MHRKLFAYLFVAALLSSAVVVFADSDSSDAAAPTESKIVGYLGLWGDNSSSGAPGYTVKVYTTTHSANGISDDTGKFEINISEFDSTDVFITIENDPSSEKVYIIRSGPYMDTVPNVTTYCSLDLTKCPIEDGAYNLGSEPFNGIQIGQASVDCTFTIQGKDKFLKNAIVSLYTSSSQVKSEETGSNGKCVIENVDYGTYTLKVTCNGYQNYSSQITITDGDIPVIVLTEKEVPTFYGMTTYHALLIVGVTVGLILVMIAYTMVRHNSKGIKD
jgi:hypothetical protein